MVPALYISLVAFLPGYNKKPYIYQLMIFRLGGFFIILNYFALYQHK